MIRQGVPEVTLHCQLVQIANCLSTMCSGVSPRTKLHGSTTTIRMTCTSFDIRYNCILEKPFLLTFMAVICTVYATIKMSGPKGVITL
jgi:hypothetical protein